MNKQELIETIETMPCVNIYDEMLPQTSKTVYVPKEKVITAINQLDEPQKAVIPRFVAEWIEECKADEECLSFAIGNSIPHDVSNWLALNDCKNEDLFARAWLDGYEIEQEKLYTVVLPNGQPLVKKNLLFISQDLSAMPARLTEAEIKQDFEWAWQWAEEVADEP